jgi:N-acetylneuraminic acid mutarotase
MGAIGGKLYVAGGTDGGALTTLEVYDPTTNTWSAAAPMPAPRYQGGAGVIDNKLYVVGGWDAPITYSPKNTLLIYDAANDAWSFGAPIPPSASPPSGLSGDSTVGVIGGMLYVLTSENGYSGYVKSFYVYDPGTNSWSTRTQPSQVHAYAAGGVIDGKLYVAGGFDGIGVSTTLEVYDPSTNAWSTLASMTTARSATAGEVIDGKFYVVGGWDGSQALDTVEVYDPVTNTWSSETPIPTPVSSTGQCAAVIDGTLHIVVGTIHEAFTPGPIDVIPDIKANGEDGPLFVTMDDSVNVTISLDPGNMEWELADWFIGMMSPYGSWMLIGQPIPIFELPETSLLDIPLPPGYWFFFFILDDNPNGILDTMTWHDYVVVGVSGGTTMRIEEDLPDFDVIFEEKMKELMNK